MIAAFGYMDLLPDFLKPLEYLTRPFPRAAAEAAVARRDESIPHLLQALAWADEHPDEANDARPPYMLHLFALFMLAQFRESRAYAPIVKMFRNPKFEELTGDVVTEGLPAILASVCSGDTSLIEQLIEDGAVDEFVRGSAVKSLATMASCGMKTRREVSEYFGGLFRAGLAREPNQVLDGLILSCSDLAMTEHLDDIRSLYAEGIADPYFHTLEEVEKEIVLPMGSPQRHYLESYELIDDGVAYLATWRCFSPEEEDEVEENESTFDDGGRFGGYSSEEPYLRETPKIGRNDPCPRGSGKKYKKCCGAPVA
jgi:Protein of unknown function (DUF1186)/SEC-C motif